MPLSRTSRWPRWRRTTRCVLTRRAWMSGARLKSIGSWSVSRGLRQRSCCNCIGAGLQVDAGRARTAMKEHATVRLREEGQEADIDVGLVPLIRYLWRARIRTVNSCQDVWRGRAWIEFATPSDAERFV